MTLDLNTHDIHRPSRYAVGYAWAEWDLMREKTPIFWYERDDIEPFSAVTRYHDVMSISGHPDIFTNGGPRLRRRPDFPARRPALARLERFPGSAFKLTS